MPSKTRAGEIGVVIRYPDYTQEAIIRRNGNAYDVIFWGVVERAGEREEIRRVKHQRHRRSIVKRGAVIKQIARDERIASRSRHTQAALIDDVVRVHGVTRGNARLLIHRARLSVEQVFKQKNMRANSC